MADEVKRPQFGTIAPDDDRGVPIPGYTDTLAARDDSVLAARGGHYGIYTDLLRDDQLAATWQQRRLAVVSAEWFVEPASERRQDKAAADFIRDQLKAVQWDHVTERIMSAIFYGWGVAEVIPKRDGQRIAIDAIKVRDRGRFAWGKSGDLYLWRRDRLRYERVPRGNFWTLTTGGDHDDLPYGRGLAHHCYWPVYFKRQGVKFWLSFLDKYGAPTAVGKLPMGQFENENLKRQVLQALEAIHRDSAVVLPEEAELTLLEAFRTGSVDYDAMVQRMDAAISKVVLSQTMTTDDGSSRSQAEVHSDVRQEVTASDAALINESATRQWVRQYVTLNFPNAQVPLLYRDTSEPEDLNTRADRDKKIYDLGFEPTEDYITETYGEGWVKREPGQQRAPGSPDDLGPAFAELAALTADRNRHRESQQDMAEAAARFARDYQGITGKRVRQLLEYLEESDDLETFANQLRELLQEQPDPENVQRLQRSGVIGRLLGQLRGQR